MVPVCEADLDLNETLTSHWRLTGQYLAARIFTELVCAVL